MPRTYQKVLGPTRRSNYEDQFLQRAVRDVQASKLSVRAAAEKYGVPKSTLSDHVKAVKENKEILPSGGQVAISLQEEQRLVEGLLLCAEWGFPLRGHDITDVVASYLNRRGVVVKVFKNNRPGIDWMQNFLKRHHILTNRLAENIKAARAAVDEETIKKYFENLQVSIDGVPPENTINFDETNFSDDPGKIKVLVRRGCKHPERIIDHSKTSISVMAAVTGDGVFLPPYTVHKSQYIYPTWIEGGLPGARYGCNKSGWFDMPLFEDWFFTICLEYLKSKEGKKLIMGDNLASHLSLEVIEACIKNNIAFVLLPPNSTHLCQVLDVAVFKAIKEAWRFILNEWKKTHRGVVPKSEFPRLLKMAIEKIGQEKMKANILSGFKATGVIPLDKEAVLKKIPRKNPRQDMEKDWSDSLVEKLEETRRVATVKQTTRSRGKRFNAEPGKSVSILDSTPSTSRAVPAPSSTNAALVMEDEDDVNVYEEGDSNCDDPDEVPVPDVQREVEAEFQPKEKDFVLVNFIMEEDRRNKTFVGQVVNVLDDEKWEVKFLRKREGRKNTLVWFTFPDVPDICSIGREGIICKLEVRDLR